MHRKEIITRGKKPEEAVAVLILIHGRGGSADDILSLAPYFPLHDFALLAPQATNHSWYPYSFMAPAASNEPWLTSALSLLNELVLELESKRISRENIYFLGFSQGACLTLEFVTRHAAKYGGVIAFTGGLIGEKINLQNYGGNFSGTPIFIGSSDPDPHVPVERVNETSAILEKMGARVSRKIYKGMGHTISQEEINEAKSLIFSGRNNLS